MSLRPRPIEASGVGSHVKSLPVSSLSGVECKRYNRPVEREVILSLSSKISDVGAHKGMIFSTSGFQKGALEYATAHGIATITFTEGKSSYNTRSKYTQPIEPPWYAGWFLNYHENSVHCTLLENTNLIPIEEWLRRDGSIA